MRIDTNRCLVEQSSDAKVNSIVCSSTREPSGVYGQYTGDMGNTPGVLVLFLHLIFSSIFSVYTPVRPVEMTNYCSLSTLIIAFFVGYLSIAGVFVSFFT
jgi:hypothetical protein